MAAAMGWLEAREERPRGGGSPRGHDRWKVVYVDSTASESGRGRAVMLLEAMATKGRMGEWLDAHPLIALGIVIACVLVGG